MSIERLTSTSYLVLGLLAREGPSTPYALERHVEATLGNFWTFPHTLLYSEPARLAVMGLVVEARETESRRRRVFAITRAGEAALRAWLDGRRARRRSCATWDCSSSSSPTSRRPSRGCAWPRSRSPSTRRSWPRTRRTSASSAARRGRSGQRTVERWRGETLRMGLLYEQAAVEFWTGAVASARSEADEG